MLWASCLHTSRPKHATEMQSAAAACNNGSMTASQCSHHLRMRPLLVSSLQPFYRPRYVSLLVLIHKCVCRLCDPWMVLSMPFENALGKLPVSTRIRSRNASTVEHLRFGPLALIFLGPGRLEWITQFSEAMMSTRLFHNTTQQTTIHTDSSTQHCAYLRETTHSPCRSTRSSGSLHMIFIGRIISLGQDQWYKISLFGISTSRERPFCISDPWLPLAHSTSSATQGNQSEKQPWRRG